jgi:hypothetical protein
LIVAAIVWSSGTAASRLTEAQAEQQQSATMRRSRETADLARKAEKQIGISRRKDCMASQLFGTQPESRASALLVEQSIVSFFALLILIKGAAARPAAGLHAAHHMRCASMSQRLKKRRF